mmetsp:Transcript_9139/g.29047  ORF Transcript_9139/g.29047 Transcript_9139/m.29047 type:complete len:384 (-) Transcript_9139:28-1179(-)
MTMALAAAHEPSLGRYDPATRGGAVANVLASVVGDLVDPRGSESCGVGSSSRPCALGELLGGEASGSSRGGRRACEACGRSPPKLLSCSRCNSSFYCSVACQKVAWQRGHSRVCKRGLCEARLVEVTRRLGIDRRELAEACLEVTGQRVDAACAVASAYLSGSLPKWLRDDEVMAAFELVFGTNVKPKHLRELERLLPAEDPPPAGRKRRRVDAGVCCELYTDLRARIDGLGCVFALDAHASVVDLVDFVYCAAARPFATDDQVAAFLALADELLTPPVRSTHDLEPLRRRVADAWAGTARLRWPELAAADDAHCASVARRAEKSRFHGAQRPDINEWLRHRGHWLPKAASVDGSPHPPTHYAEPRPTHSRSALPTLHEDHSL